MARKIIIDCDPGTDDAVAILLALGNPEIDLLGLTTVGGNQTLEKVTHNARVVPTIAGRSVPVYAGCGRPLLREARTAGDIHGDTGMAVHGYDVPEPTVPLADGHAVDFIIDTIMSHDPGTVTLVPMGPLTNIALAVRKEPRIVERVQEVSMMGGGYHVGNATPVAEFNVWVDPEAAKIVFNESWPLTMVGLDLTHQALATPEVEKQFAELGTDLGRFVVGLFGAFREAYSGSEGFENPPVHDPCAVARLIDPSVIGLRPAPLDVSTEGITAGMTVADLRAKAPKDCVQNVAVELDHEKFWALVLDAVRALG